MPPDDPRRASATPRPARLSERTLQSHQAYPSDPMPSWSPSNPCGSGGTTVNRRSPISPRSRSGGEGGMQTPGELGAQAPVRTGACGSGCGPARTAPALGSAGDRCNRPAPIGALGPGRAASQRLRSRCVPGAAARRGRHRPPVREPSTGGHPLITVAAALRPGALGDHSRRCRRVGIEQTGNVIQARAMLADRVAMLARRAVATLRHRAPARAPGIVALIAIQAPQPASCRIRLPSARTAEVIADHA